MTEGRITLYEVQKSIQKQLVRDYKGSSLTRLHSILVIGLVEEAGEVAGLMKRQLRKNSTVGDLERSSNEHWIEELGDVLWYLTAIASAHGIPLDTIWEANVKKLEERYGRV